MSQIAELTTEECERLLRASVFGRAVVVTPDGPEVFPVNYATAGDAVMIRTAPGSLLDHHGDGATLLLEIDQVDHERWHGWSVVARGVGERVDPDDLTERERSAPYRPPRWVTRDQDIWVRLRWTRITGRRLGAGWDCLSELPVRRAWR